VPFDIHVDAVARYLYHIEPGGLTAMRYGVAIVRGDLYEPGVNTMRFKRKCPTWTPRATKPAAMNRMRTLIINSLLVAKSNMCGLFAQMTKSGAGKQMRCFLPSNRAIAAQRHRLVGRFLWFPTTISTSYREQTISRGHQFLETLVLTE